MKISDEAKQAAYLSDALRIARDLSLAVDRTLTANLFDGAATELDRLAKLNAELREFAQHKSACRSWPYSAVPDSLKICDCGLAQLLEKMK